MIIPYLVLGLVSPVVAWISTTIIASRLIHGTPYRKTGWTLAVLPVSIFLWVLGVVFISPGFVKISSEAVREFLIGWVPGAGVLVVLAIFCFAIHKGQPRALSVLGLVSSLATWVFWLLVLSDL